MSRFSDRMRKYDPSGIFVARRQFVMETKTYEAGDRVIIEDGRISRKMWTTRLIDCLPAPEPKAEEKPKPKAKRKPAAKKPAPKADLPQEEDK